MIPENFLIFLQIILFMFITPGAPRILIMTQSLNFGFKKSLWTAFGDISANTLQMILVLFGLTALLKVFPNIVIYFKWAGIIYLVYIAYGYIKLKLNINIKNKIKQKSIGTLYIDGFLVAFLSPKATVFFATVFPTFLIVGSNYYYHFFILLITYIFLDFFTLAIYSGVARVIANNLKINLNLINYISAGALIIIAIVIAIKV